MSASFITSAESIDWSEKIQKLAQKAKVTSQEIEEVFLNFPAIKKLSVQFSDSFDRFLVEGTTDMGKKLELVVFVRDKKIILTHIKR